MRWPLKAGLAIGLAVLVALPLAVDPAVRALARHSARARGWTLEVGEVSLGWGEVWLRRVALRPLRSRAVSIELDEVEVRPRGLLGLDSVRAHGGVVRLVGSVAEVRQALRGVSRPRGEPTDEGAVRGGGAELLADGVHVRWVPGAGFDEQHAWGMEFERAAGSWTVRFDLARLSLPGLALEARGGGFSSAGLPTARRIGEVNLKGARARVDLERLDPARWGELLHVPGRAGAPSDPPAVGRGQMLRKRAEDAAALFSRWLPESARLSTTGLMLELVHSGQSLSIGPGTAELRHEGSAVSASLTTGPSSESALSLALALPLNQDAVVLHLAGGPLSLAAVGVQQGDFGLMDVEHSRLAAEATVRLPASGEPLEFEGAGELAGVTILQPRLSPRPLRNVEVRWSSAGRLSFTRPRLQLDKVQLQVGAVRVEGAGWIEREHEQLALELRGRVPVASCQGILRSAPEGLLPELAGLQMTGTVALDMGLELDTRATGDAVVKWQLDNHCHITHVPAHLDPRRFSSAFTYAVQSADGSWLQLQAGPGTGNWVPYGRMSRYLETALLVCEDGRFWRHDGFDQSAIRNAIRKNLEAERFVLGASTLTMQLAKNLYLGREKTMTRKLQEAILTMLLEQELSKEQILELYLNVVEFGPGIYGVGPAAQFYFGSDASRLSLAQSMFLASVLPSPKQQHFGSGGRLSGAWRRYLNRLLEVAHSRERVTDEELAVSLAEPLVFGQSAAPTPFDLEHDAVLGGDPYEAPSKLAPVRTEQLRSRPTP